MQSISSLFRSLNGLLLVRWIRLNWKIAPSLSIWSKKALEKKRWMEDSQIKQLNTIHGLDYILKLECLQFHSFPAGCGNTAAQSRSTRRGLWYNDMDLHQKSARLISGPEVQLWTCLPLETHGEPRRVLCMSINPNKTVCGAEEDPPKSRRTWRHDCKKCERGEYHKERQRKRMEGTDKPKQMDGRDVYNMILPSLSEASSLGQRRERGAQQTS